MVIMTQSGNTLINFDHVRDLYITTLAGNSMHVEMSNGDKIPIAYYASKEDCLVVMSLIFDAIKDSCTWFSLPPIDRVYNLKEVMDDDGYFKSNRTT